MAKQLEIQSCGGCPHKECGSSYSLDGWDRGYDVKCTKLDRVVAKFIERPSEERRIEIPKDCPLKEI